MILGASIVLTACQGASARPILGAAKFEVFVDDDTRLGRELGLKYGKTPVAWCGDAPADWCSDKLAHTVDDPAAVAALAAFVNERLDGYQESWVEAPIPHVVTKFYAVDGDLIGTFGSGSNYFARGNFPRQKQRRASPKELEDYYSLIGLKTGDAAVVDLQPRGDKAETALPRR